MHWVDKHPGNDWMEWTSTQGMIGLGWAVDRMRNWRHAFDMMKLANQVVGCWYQQAIERASKGLRANKG